MNQLNLSINLIHMKTFAHIQFINRLNFGINLIHITFVHIQFMNRFNFSINLIHMKNFSHIQFMNRLNFSINLTHMKFNPNLPRDVRRKRFMATFTCSIDELKQNIEDEGLNKFLDRYFVDQIQQKLYLALLPDEKGLGRKPGFFKQFDKLKVETLLPWDYRRELTNFVIDYPTIECVMCNSNKNAKPSKENSKFIQVHSEDDRHVSIEEMVTFINTGGTIDQLLLHLRNHDSRSWKEYLMCKDILLGIEKEFQSRPYLIREEPMWPYPSNLSYTIPSPAIHSTYSESNSRWVDDLEPLGKKLVSENKQQIKPNQLDQIGSSSKIYNQEPVDDSNSNQAQVKDINKPTLTVDQVDGPHDNRNPNHKQVEEPLQCEVKHADWIVNNDKTSSTSSLNIVDPYPKTELQRALDPVGHVYQPITDYILKRVADTSGKKCGDLEKISNRLNLYKLVKIAQVYGKQYCQKYISKNRKINQDLEQIKRLEEYIYNHFVTNDKERENFVIAARDLDHQIFKKLQELGRLS
jgi:hypothetical protein